jgi:hypothetical protein
LLKEATFAYGKAASFSVLIANAAAAAAGESKLAVIIIMQREKRKTCMGKARGINIRH